MEPVVLHASLKPGLSAMLGVVAVLHARRAAVRALVYQGDALVVTVAASAGDADRLRAQIERRVDVLSVVVARRPPMPADAQLQLGQLGLAEVARGRDVD
jgi:RNase P/RNase MRP subunit p30